MKTVLCVPGHDEAKVKNCRQYGADLILFDLEDSVPESMKDRAQKIVEANVTKNDAVRINKLGLNDLYPFDEMECQVWLPKLHKWPTGWHIGTGVVIIVETPELLTRLHETTAHHVANLVGLAFGAADFAAYMNVPSTSPQVAYARQQVALAAKALDVDAYDSPCTTLRTEATKIEAEQARDLGYGWKGVVHPLQIGAIKRVGFGDDGDRKLVDLYEAQTEAVLSIGDKVVAPPMIRAARERLKAKDGSK